MLAGKAVMMNWSDVAVQDRPAYYRWHNREHMVGRLRIPGYRRGRRFLALRARRTFLVLYEVDDLQVLVGRDYLDKANNPSPLTRSTTKLIQNSVRALAQVKLSLGFGQGAFMLTVRFDAAGGREGELEGFLTREALPRAAEMPEIVAAHFCLADMEASLVVPVERQGRPTEVPKWIAMLEGVTPEAVERACDAQLSPDALTRHGAEGPIQRDLYRNEITVSRMPA